MSKPLAFGLLGASRISEDAVTDPSREIGHRRYAVAARNTERAEKFARDFDYEKVHASYEDLLADEEVDIIYNGLPNGLHALWTAQALRAGRTVLCEKPFASNLAEYDAVMQIIEETGGLAWEGFHHAYHPIIQEILNRVESGSLGDIKAIDIHMNMPNPGADDPRWLFDLAGGAVMDLGCYAYNTALMIAETLGEELRLVSANGEGYPEDLRVDQFMEANFLAGSIPVHTECSMISEEWDFTLRITGSKSSIWVPYFLLPNRDDRIVTTSGDKTVEEHLGTRKTYLYQMESLAQQLETNNYDTAFWERSRATAVLIDEVYRAARFPLRPAHFSL